jgi:kynurenine formamidase
MKWKKFIVGYILALAILLFAQRRPSPTPIPIYSSIVDLTHSLNADRATDHTRRPAALLRVGTHIDAPSSYARSLWTVDQIPSQRLIAPLVVLDVRSKADHNPDYQVSMDDIIAWEKAHGPIPMAAVVMARTGWDYRWNSVRQYTNTDRKGVMHFPGYSLEAAQFLVQGRASLAFGIDTLSIDNQVSKGLPVSNYTLSHSLYQLENVANLGAVPESGATVVVAPAKLEGGSGAPVRILALVK